jgi:hypothetical protein
MKHRVSNAQIARELRREAAIIRLQRRRQDNRRLAARRRNAARTIQQAFRSHLWAPPHGPFYMRLHREMAGTGPWQGMAQEPSEVTRQREARTRTSRLAERRAEYIQDIRNRRTGEPTAFAASHHSGHPVSNPRRGIGVNTNTMRSISEIFQRQTGGNVFYNKLN